jgi:hypothetical protein
MSICEQLRISDTFFDGYELPLTIQDVLIFFSTEIEDQNNIPRHIKDLLDVIRLNSEMTDEELIIHSDLSWFSYNVSIYINPSIQNENPKLVNFYSIFNFCIEHYDIYQTEGMKRFRNTCQEKINEVLSEIVVKHFFNFNKNHPCYPVYEKCHQLQDLHIRDRLVHERSLIYKKRGDKIIKNYPI